MCDNDVDWGLARAGAQRLLRARGVYVAKVNPLDDDEFVLMTDRFSKELTRASGPIDRRAVAAAIASLNVAWTDLTAEVRAAIIAEASKALNVGAEVAAVANPVLGSQMQRTIQGTKRGVASQLGITIDFSFTATDARISGNVLKSNALFVTDEYRKHQKLFSRKASDIVASGLDKGLRTEAITEDLFAAARAVGLNRPANYWRVVSSAATNRARTLTQLTNYQEAGIDRYEFQAVVDQRTTDICRMLDGRIFNVADSLAGYRQVENAQAFDAVKNVQPWVRVRNNPDGTKRLFFKQRDGTEVTVAKVERSAVGKVDDRGKFSGAMSNTSLAQFGLIQPPLHGLCRSVVVPLTG